MTPTVSTAPASSIWPASPSSVSSSRPSPVTNQWYHFLSSSRRAGSTRLPTHVSAAKETVATRVNVRLNWDPPPHRLDADGDGDTLPYLPLRHLRPTRPPKTSPGPVPDTSTPVEAFGSLERPSRVRRRSLLRHSQ
jgi:hypothetical protein